ITADCKEPEIAARWIDYMFSEEGSLLLNYGIEGDTFTMVDGKPQFTDKIVKNPEGLSVEQCRNKYLANAWAKVYDWNTVYQSNSAKVKEAGSIWKANMDYAWIMPPVTITSDEGAEQSGIMGDINTYISEMIIKFIMGAEPLSKYDEFVNRVKEMNIDKVIQIQQAALDRYMAR
ncbi:MAG: ABC transporter substrate-binding protein, partial [Clostridiales bacterium]|nr:ABC transporter substrate-binding protein [Clostridiales bacterium]